MRDLVSFLRERRSYAFIMLAFLISGIGSGLTSVAVFSRLSEIDAQPACFALAFALSTMPVLIATRVTMWLSKYVSPRSILFWSEIIQAASLMLLFLSLRQKSVWPLLAADFVCAFIAALSFPYLQLLIKQSFDEKTLPIAAKVDTYIFAANLIFGTLIGSVLISFVGYETFLAFDLLSFMISALLIATSKWTTSSEEASEESAQPKSTFSLLKLPLEKRRAFLVSPLLTLIGAAPVALLPSMGERLGANVSFGKVTVAASMFLLIAKCTGQCVGPLMIPESAFSRMSKNDFFLVGCLTIFFGIYLGLGGINKAGVLFLLIVLAHIMSNIVYMLGFYLLQKHFSEGEMLQTSAEQVRWQMLILTAQSLLASALSTVVSQTHTILILSGTGLIALVVVLFGLNRQSQNIEAVQSILL